MRRVVVSKTSLCAACCIVHVLSLVSVQGALRAAERETSTTSVSPRDEREWRIIINWDEENLWFPLLKARGLSEPSGEAARKLLEEIIDEHAAAKVDTVVQVIFGAGFKHLIRSSKGSERFPAELIPRGLEEIGLDFPKILVDRCHHHNMQFIAGLRMNDRHDFTPTQFIREHPEWQLGMGNAMDYAFEPVRSFVLTFVDEVLDEYEVDGLEYDYMRWCHMFKPGEGKENAHLLTEFMRKTRRQLDAAAGRRGCNRLLLGVRVPQSIEECDYLGFDLETWINEGLVDYIVPSDFMHTDTNMKTEDFVKLAEGTNCKIYPAIHNRISMDGPNEHYRLMTLANYRAAAQNFYRFGADGVSPYNYQFAYERRGHAHRSSAYAAYMWPAALGWLRDIRDLEEITSRDRHYLFYSLWKKSHKSPTSFSHNNDIYLDRAKPVLEGSWRFRMAEDFSNPKLRTTMQFKALGLAEDEKLEIQINDKQVPAGYITRVYDKDGQSLYEGDPLDPFHLYVIDMNWETTGRKQPLIFGDNQLTIHLVPSAAKAEGTASIEELECYVYVRK